MSESVLLKARSPLLGCIVLAVCVVHSVKPLWPLNAAMLPLDARLASGLALLLVQLLILRSLRNRRDFPAAVMGTLCLVAYVFLEGAFYVWIRHPSEELLLFAWGGGVNLAFNWPSVALFGFGLLVVNVLGDRRHYL